MTDKWKVKVCCDAMGDAVMMNDIREGIAIIDDKLYIVWSDGDCMPLNYCPSCGRKVEMVGVTEETRDCLNCSASFSDDDENGNMILRCAEHDWKIVDENGCCDEWN